MNKSIHIHNTCSEITCYIIRLSPRQRNHAYECFATCIHKANPLNLKQYNVWTVSNPLWLCCCTVYWWEASRFLAPKNVGFQLTHNPLSMLPISLHMGMEDVHITPFVLRCWIPQPSINAINYSPYAYGGCTYYIIRIEMLDSTTFYQCSQLLSICMWKVHVLHHLY